MKAFKSKKIFFLGALFSSLAQAEFWFSFEKDAIPLVSVTVVLPMGTENADPKHLAAAALMSDMLDGGTQTKNKQEYLDALSEFGASTGFSMGSLFSTWQVEVPIVEGKTYTGLAKLLEENWKHPRLTQENFESAKRKLIGGMVGGLDNDWSIVSSTPRRLLNVRDLGTTPLFLEAAKAVQLSDVVEFYQLFFQQQKVLWAGVVGPESQKDFVKSILSQVFGLTTFHENFKLQALADYTPKRLPKGQDKTFLIIDKAERNQNITLLMSFRPEKLKASEELPLRFGSQLMVEGGLSSIWGEAMRSKGGFAYSVAPLATSHLGFPTQGYATNPTADKSHEALKVMSSLIKDSYASGKVIQEMTKEKWDASWRSFSYGRLLSRSTASGRLSEISSVIMGSMSPEFYRSKSTSWRLTPDEVVNYYTDHWKKSRIFMAILGDTKTLEPWIKENFPDFKIKKISYKDSIQAGAYSEAP